MRQASRASWSVVLGLAALLAGGSGPISASQTGDTFVFRSGVEAVQLDAFVTDRRGNPVTDLTADDFEIIESGQPQTIESFWQVDIPLVRTGVAAPTAPPIGPAAEVFANGQDHGRIYVIVLGDVSWQGALRARQHLQRFLDDHFGDTDLATVVSLTHGGAMRFTSDRALLAGMAGHVFAGRDEDGLPFQARTPVSDRAREQTRLFGLIAEALAGVPARRKAILLISESLGFDAFDVVDNPRSAFSRDARAALEPVTRGNIAVYTLHPGGAISPMGLRPGAGLRGPTRGTMSRLRLSSIAHVTGGFAIGSDIRQAFDRIVRENSTYYVLGYYSTNSGRNAGYRRVQVRVTRPGLTVRSRSGYFVADPTRPAPRVFEPPVTISASITSALASPVPLNTVPIRLSAAAFLRDGRDAAVSIVAELDTSALDLEERDGMLRGLVDVTSIGLSGVSTYPGVRHSGELEIPVRLRGEAVPLRILTEIRLPPGRYQLRLAAGVRDGRTGTVLSDVEVPDFRREPLMVSGLALGAQSTARVPTLEARDTLEGRLPVPPTTRREFERGDTLVLFAEVYENLWNDTEHAIVVRTALRGADGTVVPMSEETRSSTAPTGEGGGHAFTATLPLHDVPPGAWTLELRVEADAPPRTPVVRELAIRIR